MEMMRNILVVLLTIGASVTIANAQSTCAASGGLNFICGIQAPEDLVLVPASRFLIASGMAAGSGLHLIDTQAKTARSLFAGGISPTRPDTTKFAGCPGPLDG